MIPDQLQYAQQLSALPEQGLGQAIDHATSQLDQLQSDDVSAALAKSYDQNEPPDTIPTQSMGRKARSNSDSNGDGESSRRASIPSRRSARLSSQRQTADTQTSNVTEMREAFRSFMQPEVNTQGDTQTQAPFFPALAASETTASPSRGEQSPLAQEYNGMSGTHTKLALSQTATDRLEQGRKQKRCRSAHRAKGSKSSRKECDVVTCECGCMEEEGCMVFLSSKSAKKHRICSDISCRSSVPRATPGSTPIATASLGKMTFAFRTIMCVTTACLDRRNHKRSALSANSCRSVESYSSCYKRVRSN